MRIALLRANRSKPIARQLSACLLVAAAIGLAPGAWAQAPSDAGQGRCSDALIQRVGAHFRLAEFAFPSRDLSPGAGNGALLVAGVCKAWPTNGARTLAAFAYDAGVDYEKQLLLALVEGPDHRVLASYKGVIAEDAATELSSQSLRLDTARYTLSANTRAFGLRVNAFRDRCTYEGGFDDELTLFVVDGRAIRPVLAETMSRWWHGPGNRCGGEETPRIDSNVTISVEPTASHGLADLRFTAVRSDGKKPVSAVVRYDGKSYDLGRWRAALNAWWY